MTKLRNVRFLPALFLLGLISWFSFNAAAQDSPKTEMNDPFRNFTALSNYMASQGMDSAKVVWAPIDFMCAGLKSDSDETQYNKCRFEKVRNSHLHKIDKSQCSVRATGSYPDSFKVQRKDTLSETDKNGQVHTFERTTAPVSAAELEQLRAAAIVACMQSLGWASADDWTLGRRDVCP